MGSEAEAGLLGRCRRGEAAAWDELFDQHYAAAGRFIFQLGHDLTREDAEELCQEVFLSVIKNLDSFHARAGFKPGCFALPQTKPATTASGARRPNGAAARRPSP